MIRLSFLAGALVLALSLPVLADDCQYTLDGAVKSLAGYPSVVISDPDAIKAIEADILAKTATGGTFPTDISRLLIAEMNGTFFIGFEEKGCLSTPFVLDPGIGKPLLPTVAPDSGKTNAGTGA